MVILDLLKSLRTTPKAEANMVSFSTNEGKRVGKSDVNMLRFWAEHSEWVRAAINVRKDQVSSAEWDIVPFDPNVSVDNVRLAKRIRKLFETPNPRTDSFRSFIEPVIEDILVLDAGCIEKVPNLKNEVSEIWPVDGGKIKVSRLWDGSPVEPRYYYYPSPYFVSEKDAIAFVNRWMIYVMSNPRSYSVIGLAPLETLKLTIDSELSGSQYNRRQVTSAAPDGALYLGDDVNAEQRQEFKAYWDSEVAGKGAMAFISGSKNPTFIPFRSSNRDMQFLEWQIYLVRKIAAVFQLSPQDLGVTFDINRATSEVQSEMTEDRGLRPLLGLIQDYLTREIVWDEGFGGPDNNLAFRFTRLNLKETTSKAQIDKLALAGVPWKTVNEARVADGREPLGPEFDQLIMSTPVGAVSLTDIPTVREAMGDRASAAPPTGASK